MHPMVCPHFLSGTCRFGDRCRLAHQRDAPSPTPPIHAVDTKVSSVTSTRRACTFYNEGRCNKGSVCPFRHDDSRIRSSVCPSTTMRWAPLMGRASPRSSFSPCAFFLKGSCAKGSTCPFPHPASQAAIIADIDSICSYYLAGTCRFGSQCSSSHVSSERTLPAFTRRNVDSITLRAEGSSQIVAEDFKNKGLQVAVSKNAVTHADERDIPDAHCTTDRYDRTFCHCKVFFGPGAIVEELITPFESRTLIISNVEDAATQISMIETFTPFGALQNISLLRDNDTAMARVTYASVSEAATAIRELRARGSRYEPKMDLKMVESGQVVLRSTKVKVSWFAPRRIGWAHYFSITKARDEAARLDGAVFDGSTIKAKFQTPSFRQTTSFSVEIKGLPSHVDEFQLKRFCHSNSVTLKKAGFDRATSLLDVEAQLKAIGPLDSYDVLPEDKGKSKIIAFAQFSHPDYAAQAVATLHNSTQSYLNRSPMWLEHIHAVKYTVPAVLFAAIKRNVEALVAVEEGECRLRWYEPQDESQIVCIRLFGPNPHSLGLLKRQLEKVLEGTRLVDEEGKVVWDEFLATPAGAFFFRTKCQGVYVKCDSRNRTVHLFGAEGVLRAREMILERLEALRNDEKVIQLERQQLVHLMKGGMEKLKARFGGSALAVNIVRKTLAVGEGVDVDELRLALRELNGVSPGHGSVAPGTQMCPVCYCDATKQISLKCGHVYCKECLTHMLSSTSTDSPSVKCIYEGDNLYGPCDDGIPTSIVRQLLRPDQEQALFEAAFLAHVHSHPSELKYCPTPDCKVVYRVGDEGTVFTCPSCLNRICAACQVQFHEGLSCAEHRDNVDGGVLKFQEWKAQSGIKECPKCGANIEKIDGCNHMTCLICKTHMCWVCLKTFSQSRLDGARGVYDHMRKAHGSIQ